MRRSRTYEASYGRMAAMVGGRNQAEDIAQEAFARALIPAAAERHA